MLYEDSIFEFISTVGRLRILTMDGPQRFEEYHELVEKLVFLTNFLRTSSKRDESVQILAILNAWKDDFRTYFAESTYKYEYLAAQKFLDGTIHFDDFVTHRYRLLISYEQALINKHLRLGQHKYLFVGGGPFPVSAILMAMTLKNVAIYILDQSPEACITATDIIQKMHLQNNIHVLPPVKIEDYKDINVYDVIHFASMVGLSEEEKAAIYRSTAQHLASHKHILTRCSSSYSMSSMLYAGFPELVLKDVFTVKETQEYQQPVIVSNILIERI